MRSFSARNEGFVMVYTFVDSWSDTVGHDYDVRVACKDELLSASVLVATRVLVEHWEMIQGMGCRLQCQEAELIRDGKEEMKLADGRKDEVKLAGNARDHDGSTQAVHLATGTLPLPMVLLSGWWHW